MAHYVINTPAELATAMSEVKAAHAALGPTNRDRNTWHHHTATIVGLELDMKVEALSSIVRFRINGKNISQAKVKEMVK